MSASLPLLLPSPSPSSSSPPSLVLSFTEHSESDASTTYPLVRVVCEQHTTAGIDVHIADSPAYGRMLFLDGELQSAAADEHVYHESLVHPAMALGNSRERVLVVGGGEGATVREVVRWWGSVMHVDWVDFDGELVDLCAKHLGWAPDVRNHPVVHFHAMDIRIAWPLLKAEYDVIILDLPDPDGDTGYLYSTEFWNTVKERLAPGGRIVTHCGPVRPFGRVGEGFQRIRSVLGSGSDPSYPDCRGFYRIGIPSFQGDWGFWLWRSDGPAFNIPDSVTQEWMIRMPLGLKVVDEEQIREWIRSTRLWRQAVRDA